MSSERNRLLADALICGMLGYAVVVVFFAVLNLMQGRSPFYTAAVLGGAIFGGVRETGAVVVEPGVVLAFNGVHLLAFLAFGFFAAWLVYETELHPEFWYLAFVLFVAGALVSYAVVLGLTIVVGSLVSPWLVVVSTTLGALGMAAYLAAVHRPLWRSIRDQPEANPTLID